MKAFNTYLKNAQIKVCANIHNYNNDFAKVPIMDKLIYYFCERYLVNQEFLEARDFYEMVKIIALSDDPYVKIEDCYLALSYLWLDFRVDNVLSSK